ncbi:MAG TPA: class I SAM-dependent methyltransferase [Polyangiaceae bacterium]|nr:class I SAM-dependent methyltransferase [Polyangiaceae bacterium]
MIGQEIRSAVFRDTTEFYLRFPPDTVAGRLVDFVKRKAGHSVLDLGCATGNYCVALSKAGFDMKGADINPKYVEVARARGVDAYVAEGRAPFPDKSFDTVLLFEVLEHVPDPAETVAEARRLARKNVLITVPHSGGIDELQKSDLLFEHFADSDHKHFYTEASLGKLLSAHFSNVHIEKGDAISPFALAKDKWLRSFGTLLMKVGVVRPRFHVRLYAAAE